jgi:hypothetical protein
MYSPEPYKEGAIDKIMRVCPSISVEDIEIIGDVIQDTLTQHKADIVDEIGVDIASGITDRVNLTLANVRSA